MHMSFTAVMFVLGFCGVTHAQDARKPWDCDARQSQDSTLFATALDDSLEQPRRASSLERLKELARQCPLEAYQLGLLYRHGADLPGNFLAKDSTKARPLILSYAEAGYSLAYADLAEMALAEGDAREAMKWAQVYLYLRAHSSSKFDHRVGSFDLSGYNADLLRRAQALWRRKMGAATGLIQEDLNGYFDSVGEKPGSDLRQREVRPSSGAMKAPQILKKGSCSPSMPAGIRGGYAVYLVEVEPTGRASRVLLQNFSPSPVLGEKLKACALGYVFAPFTGEDLRYGVIPVMFGSDGGATLRIGK
ncbi:hypothetical protein [Lysobacter silvisoli]|uniref:hypothetical protein n=1 Tax=Lysobacter silvisoli TaxID=2293254 RepID=UPI0011C07A99|nr:hypothetical protein [Lysobacter silvisoli]